MILNTRKAGRIRSQKENHQRSYLEPTGLIYNDDDTEFLMAVDKYKTENKISFLHVTEYLAILKSLGYIKMKGG